MFKTILLPSDGSAHSNRAATYAVTLAKKFGGKIHILFAIDNTALEINTLTNVSKHEMARRRKEKFSETTTLCEENGIESEIIFVEGDPGPSIVDFANKGKYDCVVIGSRGLNKFQTMVLGSVSHKVIKRVNVPVLVVK